MSIDPGENRNGVEDESLKLSIDHKEDSKVVNVTRAIRMDDHELFLREAFRKDEWLGCTLLFDHYYAPMCSHAVRYVYSTEYAEDVVADVFREFWQKKQFNKVTTSFRTYLFRAVRNRAMNMIRRELRQTNPLSEDWDAVSETLRPDEQMIYDQFYQKIQSCIDQLPPMCRKVFLMSRYEGKYLSDIADFHRISILTVEEHISKALGVLRTTLKNEN